MAKTADKPAPPAASGSSLSSVMLLGVIGLVAVAGGAAVPFLVLKGNPAKSSTDHDVKLDKEHRPVVVPFGDAVVNLAEGRATRYLRVKLMLVVDEAKEKTINDLVTKNKAFLKSWLLSHLADRSLEEVIGKAAQNRLRREIRDEFNARLFPDGSELVRDVLFEEFLVQ